MLADEDMWLKNKGTQVSSKTTNQSYPNFSQCRQNETNYSARQRIDGTVFASLLACSQIHREGKVNSGSNKAHLFVELDSVQ